jgi:hypothetical protein
MYAGHWGSYCKTRVVPASIANGELSGEGGYAD